MPDTSLDPSPDVPDLRDLFDAAPPPDLTIDPAAVVAGGRRRVQRRRTVRGVAGSLAALAVVGGLTLGAGHRLGTQGVEIDRADLGAGQGTAVAMSGGPQADPPLPQPTGSCTSSAASVPDVAGEPTPHAAARTLRLRGFDASGAWRESDRTATRARLYKDGVWVSTVRTARGGWAVDGWTVCEGYTPPPLPPAVPETATAQSVLTGDRDITYSVRLDGDPLWPRATLLLDGSRPVELRPDDAFAVPGSDVRAYRGGGHTLLIAPLDGARAVTLWGTLGSPGSGGPLVIGGVRYTTLLGGPEVTPRSITGVLRQSPGGAWSADGGGPGRTGLVGDVRVTVLEVPAVEIIGNDDSYLTGPLSTGVGLVGSWTAGPDAARSVAVVPLDARDVAAGPGVAVATGVVAGRRYAVVSPGRGGGDPEKATLTWTDAAGDRWRLPPGPQQHAVRTGPTPVGPR